MRVLQLIDDWLAVAEGWALVVLVTFLVTVSFAQVVLRNLFRLGLPWADLILRHAVLWTGFIGASLATRQGRHIAIDVASRLLGPKARRLLAASLHGIACLISILLAHAATSFVAMERLGGGLLAGNLPTWWAQVILPLGFGFMAFRFALRAALFAAGRLEPPKLEETL